LKNNEDEFVEIKKYTGSKRKDSSEDNKIKKRNR